jgi:hypothetical protein
MSALRIAAHVHSDWSYDGEWSLNDLVVQFRRRGYDAVLMAEHDRGFDHDRWEAYQRACADSSTEQLLLVPGMEYADADNVVHIVVWGDSIPFLGSGRPTLDVLRNAHERSATAVFAHPGRRNALARYRPEWAPFLTAVEVWNRKYDGVAPGRGIDSFARREQLPAFVALDFHTRRQFFPLAIGTSLEGSPSVPAVVDALRTGAFRPEFMNTSALRFTHGFSGASLSGLEGVRRIVRPPLRWLARNVRSGSNVTVSG